MKPEGVDHVGVHASHCCVDHGCKYGDDDCPVVLKTVEQMYDCEDCVYEKERVQPILDAAWERLIASQDGDNYYVTYTKEDLKRRLYGTD